MNREQMIDALVKRDIEWVIDGVLSDDHSFLSDVLTGDGWVPYNQLTDEQVLEEYIEMTFQDEEE
jgi:hypothetical protein